MCRLQDDNMSDRCSLQEMPPLKKEHVSPKPVNVARKSAQDGGWGYMVVLGSFFSYFIADGWAYSFGVIFTEFIGYFKESHGKTAIIGALVYAVPLTLSPLICALCNLYGCRKVGVIGGFICSVSFISSFLADSVEFLCITLGVFASVGLSMTYLSALLSVTYYFDKKRGLAIGLAVTGSGVGAVVFPPMVEYFIKQYTWRGALLLLGGIFLNVIPASALFRPLSDEVEFQKSSNTSQHNLKPQSERETDESLSGVIYEEIDRDTTAKFTSENKLKRTVDCHSKIYTDDNISKTSSSTKISTALKAICIELMELKRNILNKEVLKNGWFLMFGLSTFITYLWIGSLYVYLVDRAILIGISHTYSAFLLSVIGIGRIIGQILLGYLGDQSYVNCILLYACSIAVCGLVNLILPLCFSYFSLVVVCLVFGFFVSSTYTLQIICIVNLMGLDQATSGFGILQLIEGIATVIGTPLTGWMYDSLKDYSLSFYIAGGMLVFSSVLLLPVFVELRKRNKKNPTKK